MSRRPLHEKLRTAAEWLEVNNAGGDEEEDCQHVAGWLRAQANRMELEVMVSEVARLDRHLTKKAIRERLRKKEA